MTKEEEKVLKDFIHSSLWGVDPDNGLREYVYTFHRGNITDALVKNNITSREFLDKLTREQFYYFLLGFIIV